MQFLEDKQFNLHARAILDSTVSSALDTRSVLWSLGYYGSTQEGFNKLAQEGIIKRVIEMSMKCPTLSLRGTCRYVMNMFCHSEEGRNYLTLRDFTINRGLLCCFPRDPNLLFQLQDREVGQGGQSEETWREYEGSLVPLGESKLGLTQLRGGCSTR